MTLSMNDMVNDASFHGDLLSVLDAVNPFDLQEIDQKLDCGYFSTIIDNKNIHSFIRGHTVLKSLLFLVDRASLRNDVNDKMLKRFFWNTVIHLYVMSKA